MQIFTDIEQLWDWLSRASDALALIAAWCSHFMNTQRLLLPTAVVVVIWLWVKMCPAHRRVQPFYNAAGGRYDADVERWSTSSSFESLLVDRDRNS